MHVANGCLDQRRDLAVVFTTTGAEWELPAPLGGPVLIKHLRNIPKD